jgi:hypothetical protein
MMQAPIQVSRSAGTVEAMIAAQRQETAALAPVREREQWDLRPQELQARQTRAEERWRVREVLEAREAGAPWGPVRQDERDTEPTIT